MDILVTTASKYGATREIGESIARVLRDEGHQVVVADAADVGDISGFEAVVIGGAVYAGRWPRAGRDLIERAAKQLATKPLWVFSSGPLGDPPKPEGPPEGMAESLAELAPRDHVVFPGKLAHNHLRLGDKAIVKALRAPEGDFRDWPAIEAWTRAIHKELTS